LKVKRYQLKKRMQEGKDKPKHIRHDHWVKLSKLILEEKKQQEAEKLRYSRAQVRRPSSAGRNEEYVRAQLVSLLSITTPTSQLAKHPYPLYIGDPHAA
jgi:hypothetical protein